MNKDFSRLYVYWFVSRPFLLDCVAQRERTVALRDSASSESGAQTSPSGHLPLSKSKSKLLLSNERFSELLKNLALITVAVYFLLMPAPKRGLVHLKTSIGGKVIFEGYFDRNETVIMPYWEGDFFNRTQKVTYTTISDMHKLRQKELDKWGWVW